MDELRDIASFVEVARARNFGRAAARLGVPASTLSRRIAELEAGLGAQLLVRTTRRVDLTEAGALFLSRCEDIVEAARGARAELSELVHRPRGTLRVSVTPDFATAFLALVVVDFCKRHPEIDLRLDLSPRRADLLADGVDVAIRIGTPQEPYLFARKLISARRGLYASPAYLAAAGAPLTPIDLTRHQCLSVSSGQAEPWVLRRGEERAEIPVRGPVQANAPGIILRLAAGGLGIAAADEVMASAYLARGELVTVLPDWSIRPVPIHAVTATKVYPVKTRLFLEFVQAALKGFGAPA
ncbi:LysR family transcriptional regulator [uncultured Caulobacter sp.]|uniref:LysR family transcriptional regulator n=1 Tax=uncultured Caulobacter sp. TaxID=158749 RepID=UPI002602AEF7|nr:LysR family transcriptional regulator [uncultured Caulobacter sp.]